MHPYVQANTDGRLHPANEPSISPLNRGFLYGDAIYEVWRTYQGVLFAWEEHWERLRRSASALFFDLTVTPEQMLPQIRRTAAAFRAQTGSRAELYVRLQIARGEGSIGLDPALAEALSYVILVQENKSYSEEKFAAGLTLSIARNFRRNAREALDPAWKTGNYLNNILCLREARSRGADEVLICNQHGEVTEAAVSNIGFVKGRDVFTPGRDQCILSGITRQLLIEKVAPAAGIKVVEGTIRPDELADFDECFLLSSTKDLTPVTKIDTLLFKHDRNSVTMLLKKAFARFVDDYVTAHPGLRIDS